MLFADGHVEFLTGLRVATAVQRQGVATNLLAVP